MRKVRIGLIQMSCAKGPEVNLKKAVSLIRRAAAHGARIVSLQELFKTRYFCRTRDSRNFKLAEPVPGQTTQILSRLARELSTVLIAPLFEKTPTGLYYNTTAVLDADGRFLGKYRKMHIPYDPGFYEKFYFSPGDKGFRVFQTRYAKIAAFICWDQWFPEAARIAALSGAQIIFYPTAIGWKPQRREETKSYHESWETIQRAHAIANSVYVAAANRVGREGGLGFWGGSFVADPFGGVLKRAGTKEGILVADCDLSLVEKTRREWPFLRDRRVDAYGSLDPRGG